MVSLILLSHSEKIAEGLKDLAFEMAREIPIYSVGGDGSGGLGSDYEKIRETILNAYTDDGIIILFDLGSSRMTASLVLEELDEEMSQNIKILNIPLVEGAVTAAVTISSGASLNDIVESLKEIEMIK